MTEITLNAIRDAAVTIAGKVVRTPCIRSASLSRDIGAKVFLKLENLQHTGSFKARGALVKLNSIDQAGRKSGVVAASAGNHAQGVAYHAQNMGIEATIVMPEGTPFTKIARTEEYGASVVLFGQNLADSGVHALELAERDSKIFVHPYDDERVILGQGSVGLEMLDDVPDLEILVVPIGGGGLIAGIATVAKAINPDIDIIGVEAALYPSMNSALEGHGPAGSGTTVADGIAVKTPGALTRPIIETLVSDIVLVDEAVLEKAVLTYLEKQRIVTEGAGAASLAAVMNNPERFSGKKVGLVVSGGNIDSRLLSSILMRGLVREGRLVRLRIKINDQPGVLAKITGLIGDSGGNIIEVYHQRLFYDNPVRDADVDVIVETLNVDHVRTIMTRLEDAGYPSRLLGSTSVDNSG